MSDATDPVVARREQMGRLAARGKQFGYALLLFAIALFIVGAVRSFTTLIVNLITAALLLSSAALIPSIIIAYGVKKAAREDPQANR